MFLVRDEIERLEDARKELQNQIAEEVFSWEPSCYVSEFFDVNWPVLLPVVGQGKWKAAISYGK